MKFSATLVYPDVLREVTYALSFTRKYCVFSIDRQQLQLICQNDINSTQVWARFDVNEIFTGFRITSVNNNRITFEVSLESFIRALKSFSSAGNFGTGKVKVKLVRRNELPSIMFSVDQDSGRSINHSGAGHGAARIAQTVPVRIIKSDIPKEPETRGVDVVLFMKTQMQSVLKLCERYRNLGQRVKVSANSSGVLKLGVNNDHVKVETKWTGLIAGRDLSTENENPDGDQEDTSSSRDPDEFASVLVDAKELCSALRIYSSAASAILCISDGGLLYFVVTIAGLEDVNNVAFYLTCYSR
ncbi:checkpoint protein Hus1/Mec3 [Lipomyces oligophaga]|uniref:checkpoint protein Hus1/Mec3 n=1 Tax=Lipomyces oligophaga TaxID=45792 RepID=UPI0034CDD296